MIPSTSLYGIWYLIALPIIATVTVTVIRVRRGRYDFASVIVLKILLPLSFFVPELMRAGKAFGVIELPIYIATAILSLPAIEALILSGIAYAIFGSRRKTA